MATSNTIARSMRKLLRRNVYAFSQSPKQSVWTPDNVVKSPFRDIDIPNKSVAEHIWENLDRWSDKTALVCGTTNRSITYHQLYKTSQIFAAQLRSKFNINDGDVVCVMMNNIPEYAPVLLGSIEAGAAITTVNPTYTAYEVQRQITLSNPKVLVGSPDSVPILKEALKMVKVNIPIITCGYKNNLPTGTVSFQELVEDNHADLEVLRDVKQTFEDVILLPYSSGTTGLPKGVELTNKNIIANIVQQDEELIRHYDDTTSSHQDSVLAVLPFYHIYGLSIIMLHKLSVGCKLVTLEKFQPNTLVSALENFDINLLCAAPPLILFLGSYNGIKPKHLESVKRLTCGASPLPQADVHSVLQKTKHTEILQVYGLTETSPLVTTFKKGHTTYTSVGIPIPNTELRIVNTGGNNVGPNQEGELYIKGPQVMKGYRNNPDATSNCLTEDGWFKSGDLATIDAEGVLTIADRLKELIKVKGFQVAPAELENILKEHPHVLDAGVVGKPDKKAGELPIAFVVLREGQKSEAENISKFVAERVTDYKRLSEVIIVDSLPKNPSGKLLRRVLKEKITQ